MTPRRGGDRSAKATDADDRTNHWRAPGPIHVDRCPEVNFSIPYHHEYLHVVRNCHTAFFAVLLSRDVARRVAAALSGETSRTVEVGRVGQADSKTSPLSLRRRPVAALTLLSTPSAARLVDLIVNHWTNSATPRSGPRARCCDSCQTLERLFG